MHRAHGADRLVYTGVTWTVLSSITLVLIDIQLYYCSYTALLSHILLEILSHATPTTSSVAHPRPALYTTTPMKRDRFRRSSSCAPHSKRRSGRDRLSIPIPIPIPLSLSLSVPISIPITVSIAIPISRIPDIARGNEWASRRSARCPRAFGRYLWPSRRGTDRSRRMWRCFSYGWRGNRRLWQR
jgi:hypothetical protein